MYNLLIGGEAGQGIETTTAILEKLLKQSGYNVSFVRRQIYVQSTYRWSGWSGN